SYHDPARMVTQQYPEEPAKLPAAYRNFPFLVSENATDPMGTMRCVACQICEKECPPQCIYIEKSKDKKPDATGKLQLYPAAAAAKAAAPKPVAGAADPGKPASPRPATEPPKGDPTP